MKDRFPFFNTKHVDKEKFTKLCNMIVEYDITYEFLNTSFVKGICLSVSDYCGNVDGPEYGKGGWKKYYWIFGKGLNKPGKYKQYAIRFNRDEYTLEQVKQVAVKLVKRHARRWLLVP